MSSPMLPVEESPSPRLTVAEGNESSAGTYNACSNEADGIAAIPPSRPPARSAAEIAQRELELSNISGPYHRYQERAQRSLALPPTEHVFVLGCRNCNVCSKGVPSVKRCSTEVDDIMNDVCKRCNCSINHHEVAVFVEMYNNLHLANPHPRSPAVESFVRVATPIVAATSDVSSATSGPPRPVSANDLILNGMTRQAAADIAQSFNRRGNLLAASLTPIASARSSSLSAPAANQVNSPSRNAASSGAPAVASITAAPTVVSNGANAPSVSTNISSPSLTGSLLSRAAAASATRKRAAANTVDERSNVRQRSSNNEREENVLIDLASSAENSRSSSMAEEDEEFEKTIVVSYEKEIIPDPKIPPIGPQHKPCFKSYCNSKDIIDDLHLNYKMSSSDFQSKIRACAKGRPFNFGIMHKGAQHVTVISKYGDGRMPTLAEFMIHYKIASHVFLVIKVSYVDIIDIIYTIHNIFYGSEGLLMIPKSIAVTYVTHHTTKTLIVGFMSVVM